MADNIFSTISSSDQIKANYEEFKNKFVDKDKDLISQDTFLKLLVAEMSNQDPLEPTSNTEFIAQLAQFSTMSYLQDSSKYSFATYATSLVGKTVSASKFEGTDLVMVTGVVESVKFQNNSYIVTIDGEEFDISKVTIIADGGTSGSSGSVTTEESLQDKIIKASQMVGMYAWVKSGGQNADGSDKVVQGFIESITVLDGEVKIVINGTAYSIEDIDEITYATLVDEAGDITSASHMIGMYALVNTGEQDEDGNNIYIRGMIDAVKVEEGVIKVVVGGKAYGLEHIDGLAANLEDLEDPDVSDEVGDVEGVDPDDGVGDGVDGDVDVDGTEDSDGMTDVPDLDKNDSETAPEISEEEEQALINQLQDLIASMT